MDNIDLSSRALGTVKKSNNIHVEQTTVKMDTEFLMDFDTAKNLDLGSLEI